MRVKLPSVALACDRTGVSDRAAAIIANAVLEDIGLVSKSRSSQVVARMKIRRARMSQRKVCTSVSGEMLLLGLFFDGRKDSTIIYDRNTKKRKRVVEEHISILSEPGSKYLGHVTPESGTACHI